ncbi:carboxypeptidase-like regulatory domain-containing protein [Gelidibacter salicanalis]|uniref:Carboxypeptidase-like regulatory domain-containing protein n=1 Tax=Gelidibacter salicanalis TaxID=291193 RepID=A0A934KQS0_9FLAO|nr:carboxypeptidase-like regulatory domain-containing protein [Gelidibacter salicanalis]MBJ7879102.1 carboxypeptidase-like regulatory domain-containing protein [Gelidibacter salicanalis]
MHLTIGQTVTVKGQIRASHDVEGIHILNNGSNTFTISNSQGIFVIPVKLNDTLTFSSVSYELKKVVVDQEIINSKSLTIYLSESITILDEVVVGKILTGDLSADLANSGIERNINFFDLGIPGYTGKPKTQSERQLYTAGDFKPIHLLALLGGSLPLDPIFNAISGRTKELKNRVHLENQDDCMAKVKSNLAVMLFSAHPLEEQYRNEFFYFCADDAQFDTLCITNDDFKMLEFLKGKLVSFKSDLQTEIQE